MFISDKTADQWGMVSAGACGILACVCVTPIIIYNARKRSETAEAAAGKNTGNGNLYIFMCVY